MYHFNKRMLKQIRLTNIIIRLCFVVDIGSCIAAVAFVKQNSNDKSKLENICTKRAFSFWISYVNFALE